MLSDWITKTDLSILNWIQENMRNEVLDVFLRGMTFLGDKGWLFILITIVLFVIPKTRVWGIKSGASLMLGFLFGNMLLKNIVQRIRPYDLVDYVTLIIEKQNDYSFPSGHTMASFEFFTVVCFMPIKKIYKLLAGILAFVIAFSRLYLYVHYPSDVLGGIFFGTVFGIMAVRSVDMIYEERVTQKSKSK